MIKRLFWPGLYVAFQLAIVGYSFHLEQDNRTTLFLDKEDLAQYSDFRVKAGERPLVIFNFKNSAPIDPQVHKDISLRMKEVKNRYQDMAHVIDLEAAYLSKKQDPVWEDIQSFITRRPDHKFNFVDEKNWSFIMAFEPETPNLQMKKAIKEIMSISWPPSGEFFGIGIPYVNYLLDEHADSIKQRLFPLMFLLAFVLLYFLTGKMKNALLLFLPCLFSATLALGLIKLIFGQINMITSIVPLLMFVINLSVSFHLFFGLMEEKDLLSVLRIKGVPFFLSLFTTAIGLGSLILAPMEAIRQFALLSSLGLVLTSLSTFTYYLIIGPVLTQSSEIKVKLSPRLFMRSLSAKSIVLLTSSIVLVAFWLIPKTQVVTDAIDYFPKKSQIKVKTREIEKRFLGNPNFEILVSRTDGKALEHGDLQKIRQMEQSALGKERLLSLNEIVADANYIYSGQKTVPTLAPSYFTLLGQIPANLKSSYQLGDNHYRITVFGRTAHFSEHQAKARTLRQNMEKELGPDYQLRFSGLAHYLLKAHHSLVDLLLKSFLMGLALISLLVSLYFRHFKTILAFALVNILPLIIVLTLFRMVGLSINVATVMTFSLALGMVVDSTIHIGHDLPRATDQTRYFNTTLRPVILSSLLTILTFLPFLFYDFLPIRQFGLALFLSLVLGLFMDLFVLPGLLKNPFLNQGSEKKKT